MTGSIHHADRPACILPEPIGPYPCHPAIVELTIDGIARDYCDAHAVEFLDASPDVVERIQIIDDHGGRRPWERDGKPDIWRTREYAARAYVDYGCCLPGQIDPAKVEAH